MAASSAVSLVRQKYLKGLSPLERWLELLPGMASLETLIEQSGHAFPAYRLVMLCAGLGVAVGAIVWFVSHQPTDRVGSGTVRTLVTLLETPAG